MRRQLVRFLSVILALLFLLEAWLWDHLEPVVARVVNIVPWGRVKVRLRRLIDNLPPYAALTIFIIPIIVVLLPLKFLEVYVIAHTGLARRHSGVGVREIPWRRRHRVCV